MPELVLEPEPVLELLPEAKPEVELEPEAEPDVEPVPEVEPDVLPVFEPEVEPFPEVDPLLEVEPCPEEVVPAEASTLLGLVPESLLVLVPVFVAGDEVVPAFAAAGVLSDSDAVEVVVFADEVEGAASETGVEGADCTSPSSAPSLPPPQPAKVLDSAIKLAARNKDGRENFDITIFPTERSKKRT